MSAKVVAPIQWVLFWFLRSGFGRFSSYTHLVCFKAYLSGIESQPLIFIMMMPSYQMLAFDHAYISQWYSQGSGESAHMRRRARTFATRLHKIWMQMNTQTLTNLSLTSFLWDICKQWISRLDAAQFGVWSGSPLFAYRMFYQHLNKDENYHSTTIQTEIDWPNWKEREIPFGISELSL